MSVKIMSMVFERYPTGGGEMILALALADHAKDDGTDVYPSIESLTEKTRQSRRTVQYQLRKMEEKEWLILVNSGNGGRNQRREYRINPAWIAGEDLPEKSKGAKSAPLNNDEKGAIDDAKGANDDIKGCNGLHPHITIIEPSMNHQETHRGKIANICTAMKIQMCVLLKTKKQARQLKNTLLQNPKLRLRLIAGVRVLMLRQT